MKTIKLTVVEAEELRNYVQEEEKKEVEYEKAEQELYLLRLKNILNKYNTKKEEIEINEVEAEAYKAYKNFIRKEKK